MNRLRLVPILALVVLTLALGAPAAQADTSTPPSVTFAVNSPGMQLAQQIARSYWGRDACGGQVAITWTRLAADINATSTWSNPTSSYDNPDQNSDCSIAFNNDVPFDWPTFCTVAVHEYGHLNGHPHSSDPNDVMTAVYNRPLAQCASTPQPGVAPPAQRVAAPAPRAPGHRVRHAARAPRPRGQAAGARSASVPHRRRHWHHRHWHRHHWHRHHWHLHHRQA